MRQSPLVAGVNLYLDRSAQQALYDVLIVLLLVVNVIAGFRQGLIRRALVLAGVFGACAAATYVGRSFVRAITGENTLYSNAWAFLAIFAIILVLVEILAFLYKEQIAKAAALAFDRAAGAVAGVIIGVAEAGVVVLLVLAVGNAQPQSGHDVPPTHTELSTAVSTSTVGGLIAQGAPGLRSLFSPVLPVDFGDHLSQR